MSDSLEHDRMLAARLSCWSAPVEPEPLAGGMSNHNFLVHDNGHAYVARIGGDHPVHNVMRFNEHACARAAYQCGLTPRIVHASDSAMVTDFVAGVTWTASDVAVNLARAVSMIKVLHRRGAGELRGPVLCFSVFHVIRHYAKLLADGNSRMSARLAEFVALADEVEGVAGTGRTVLCHNDLLAANFIDGEHQLWLIDWEHAGLGNAMFDLANLASNNELDEQSRRSMLEHYFDASVSESLWREFCAMCTLSHLREAMWSMVSELHSDIDFDFVGYSNDNLAVFEVALAGYRAL